MGITNDLVEPHMEALLGTERLSELRKEVRLLRPNQREQAVRQALGEGISSLGGRYLIPFQFKRAGGTVSHYICFVTKSELGYGIMKDIMAKRGVIDEDGVPKFEYVPSSEGKQLTFPIDRPLSRLRSDLLKQFSGRSLSAGKVYKLHHPGTQFIKRNYKTILLEMERDGIVKCVPAKRTRGLGDQVLVVFP